MPASTFLFSLPSRQAAPTTPLDLPLADVSRADDLPPFLIAGPLDRAAFACDASGWRATWRYGADAPTLSIAWRRATRDGDFDLTAPGIVPLFGMASGATLTQILRHLAPGLPRWMRHALRPRLEASANLRVPDLDVPDIVGLPAGSFATLVLPLPHDRLDELADWHRGAELDYRLATRCIIHAAECDGRVRYHDRRRVPLESNRRLAQILAEASGNATDLRVSEHPDGRIAATVDRRTAIALFVLPLAAVPALVGRLLAERFLASADFAREASRIGPFGVESAALLLPPRALARGGTVSVEDPERAIAVAYTFDALGDVVDPHAGPPWEPPADDDVPIHRHTAPPGFPIDDAGAVRLGRLDADGAALAEVVRLWQNDAYAVADEDEGPGCVCAVSRSSA